MKQLQRRVVRKGSRAGQHSIQISMSGSQEQTRRKNDTSQIV